MSKNQFTGTATQPQCNRKFCQFNNDQYCTRKRTCDCCLENKTKMSKNVSDSFFTKTSSDTPVKRYVTKMLKAVQYWF